jgi:uroporphyrinogen-III synthase
MIANGSGAGGAAKAAKTSERPLEGLTFLNTREAGTAAELTERLTRLGARVMERPVIAFVPPESWAPFDERLERLRAGDWVAFTSATAVRFVLERLRALGRSPEVFAGARIAAVGKGTAGALEAAGISVALVPEQFQGEGLLESLRARLEPKSRVWFPRAEVAREVVVEGLREAGFQVEVTPVYRNVMPEGGLGEALAALQTGRLDWLVFTSSSTVTNFLRLLPRADRTAPEGKWPRVACLGSVTAETARKEGLPVSALPERQDLDGLVDAIVEAVGRGSG